jgi:uncharacterized membrane protein
MHDRLVSCGPIGRPSAFAVVVAVAIAWIVGNVLLRTLGRAQFDSPPFPYLQDVVSTAALLTTILILGAQRQEDRLAEHRARLTLALAVLGEQKIAKIIEMLEEQRRDGRHLDDRVDEEAQAMSERTDPQSMIDAMKDAHAEAKSAYRPGT